MIERESWRIVEMIIRRYPDHRRQYAEYMESIMTSSGNTASGLPDPDYTKPQSQPEAKALKMTSVYAERIKKEIEAVEYVYHTISKEEQKVMAERFWKDRRRNIPFTEMDTGYSERQMRRIVYKIIIMVGRYLGEVN